MIRPRLALDTANDPAATAPTGVVPSPRFASPNVSYPLEGLAQVAARTGRRAEALRLFEEALALRTTALGATHPAVQGLKQIVEETRTQVR